MPYNAVFNNTPDNIALIGEGASLCASGNQKCKGANPAFVPYPISTKTKAMVTHIGSKSAAISIKTVQLNASYVLETTSVEAANKNKIPKSASVIPKLPIIKYFQAASSELGLR